MAWNRGTDESEAVRKGLASARAARTPRVRWVIAGAALAAAGVVAWIVFAPKAPEEKREEGGTKALIAEVKPSVPTNTVKKPKFPGAPLDWDKPYPPQAYRKDGTLKKYSRYVEVVTNRPEQMHHSLEWKTFRNPADMHIALLLNHEPGAMLIGDMKYGRSFVKKFLKSLETPIVISKDDTPEVAALKRAVIDAKADLKARYDRGEDIAEVMNQSRQELKELSAYRADLEAQVRQIRRDAKGALKMKDYVDLIKAANTMLENRGCQPLKVPELGVRRLELRAAQAEAREAAAKQGSGISTQHGDTGKKGDK